MGLNVDIDEQAHVLCALNADQSNYVDFVGGGNLLLNYDPTNGVQVRGRYTLSDGKMKYSLPVFHSVLSTLKTEVILNLRVIR